MERYFRIFSDIQKLNFISIALKYNLFDYLKSPKELKEIASRLQFDSKNCQIFLTALVYLGFLEKNKSFYKNKNLANRYFTKDSKFYSKELFLYRYERIKNSDILVEDLLKYGSLEQTNQEKQWAVAAKTSIRQEQFLLYKKVILKLEKEIDFFTFHSLLDLGSNAGILGLEIAKKFKNLKVTLCDFEEVLKESKKNIASYGLLEQVGTLAKDLNTQEIKNSYDIVFCSNIFYFIQNLNSLFTKIYKCLNKNGIFISLHVETSQNNINEFFFMSLLGLLGKHILQEDEVKKLCIKAGFREVKSIKLKNMPFCKMNLCVARR